MNETAELCEVYQEAPATEDCRTAISQTTTTATRRPYIHYG
jgi:hypothetical protein